MTKFELFLMIFIPLMISGGILYAGGLDSDSLKVNVDTCRWGEWDEVYVYPYDFDTLKISHNPDHEYFEITEKCDTTWCVLVDDINNTTIMGLISGDRVIHKIDCHTDTIWADKINVWLTPDEYKKLRELLGDSSRKQRYKEVAKEIAKRIHDENRRKYEWIFEQY